MDAASFLGSQTGIIVIVTSMAVAGATVFILGLGGKKEFLVILDREKASTDDAGGLSSIYLARTEKVKKKIPQRQIMLPNKTKMTIPEEEMKFADTLTIRKKLTLKAGTYRLLGKEADNLVMLGKKLADTSKLMLDNTGITKVGNRASLLRLAAGGGGILAENMLYIVLALMAGVSVGWILYPNFNHPPVVLEYCTRLANGTMNPRSCPG